MTPGCRFPFKTRQVRKAIPNRPERAPSEPLGPTCTSPGAVASAKTGRIPRADENVVIRAQGHRARFLLPHKSRVAGTQSEMPKAGETIALNKLMQSTPTLNEWLSCSCKASELHERQSNWLSTLAGEARKRKDFAPWIQQINNRPILSTGIEPQKQTEEPTLCCCGGQGKHG